MERVLEKELMDDDEQALAYARADFAEENQTFVDRFRVSFPDFVEGHLLDLGCGPADIPIRMARAVPRCRVTAVDGSPAMVRLAEAAVRASEVSDRITLRQARVQELEGDEPADGVISNSLLHHLPNPFLFWDGIKRLVKPGGVVLVMDLLRPGSSEAARAIVDRYADGAPAILRRDFYNSLLAAFTDDEVASQLAEVNLSHLMIDVIDDRHWIVAGRVS